MVLQNAQKTQKQEQKNEQEKTYKGPTLALKSKFQP